MYSLKQKGFLSIAGKSTSSASLSERQNIFIPLLSRNFFVFFSLSLKPELLRVPDVKYTEYEWLIGYRRNSTKLDLMFLAPSKRKKKNGTIYYNVQTFSRTCENYHYNYRK